MGSSKIPAALFFAVAVAIMTAAGAQPSQEPSCATQLVPCAAYINGTGKPPESCCGPMKVAVDTEMACLCNLYTTPGLLASFGFNVSQAIAIPDRCGITTASTCGEASAPNSPTSNPPPPATSGNGSGVVGRIAWTVLPGLLLFWASVMLY